MILKGYCETQQKDYIVDINILDASTYEKTEKNYGLYNCKHKTMNGCSLEECSILKAKGIKVGDKI